MSKHADEMQEYLNELAQPLTSLSGAEDFVMEGQLAIDLYQSDKNLVLEAPIGGVRSDDIDIEVTSTTVSVKGHRHKDHSTKKGSYHVDECHWGSFSRFVELPTEVNADKSQATIKNGVLRVVMPLASTPKSRKVTAHG